MEGTSVARIVSQFGLASVSLSRNRVHDCEKIQYSYLQHTRHPVARRCRSCRTSCVRQNVKSLQSAKVSTAQLVGRRSLNANFTRMLFNAGVPVVYAYAAAKEPAAVDQIVDVVTLGNLCVDVVLNVPELPPKDLAKKLKYMQQLAASSPDESVWEGGGNSNFAIAAARLGLACAALGHVGDDKYGRFLSRVLREEGVELVDLFLPQQQPPPPSAQHASHADGDAEGALVGADSEDDDDDDGSATLICWVLIDPNQQHAFCSRFDFNKNPMFSRVRCLPPHAHTAVRSSLALFCNGFVFDELPHEAILGAVESARESGRAVFFDPGPRGRSLAFGGTPAQTHTFSRLLQLSDVILLTEEEAEAITGKMDVRAAARELLGSAGGRPKWVVVKRGDRGAVLATHTVIWAIPGVKVEVADTVGCGDSFAAAIVLGFIRGVPPEVTLMLANAVGAATALGKGAGRNVATAGKVAQLLDGLGQGDGSACFLRVDDDNGSEGVDNSWRPNSFQRAGADLMMCAGGIGGPCLESESGGDGGKPSRPRDSLDGQGLWNSDVLWDDVRGLTSSRREWKDAVEAASLLLQRSVQRRMESTSH